MTVPPKTRSRFSLRRSRKSAPPPGPGRRVVRWLVYAVLALAAYRALLLAIEGLVEVDAKRREMEFWSESVLGAPSVVIRSADLHLGGLGTARLSLKQVEIEHPNADFIFGDPGRLQEPGRDVGKCLTVENAVIRLPMTAALGLRSAAAALDLRGVCLRLATNAFDESNLSELWTHPGGGEDEGGEFPLGWPSVSAWNAVVERSSLEITRTRAGVNLVADIDGSARFDLDDGSLSATASENPLVVAIGDAFWRGRWSLDHLDATLRRDHALGLGWTPHTLSLRIRNFPLAAFSLVLADWPRNAFPAGATFNGRVELLPAEGRQSPRWRFTGQFYGTGLDGPGLLELPADEVWTLTGRPLEPDGDATREKAPGGPDTPEAKDSEAGPGGETPAAPRHGWRLEGVAREGAYRWRLDYAKPDAPPTLAFHGPPAVSARLETLLAGDRDNKAAVTRTAPAKTASAGVHGGVAPTAWTWTDWIRRSAEPADDAAPAASGSGESVPAAVAWLREQDIRWIKEPLP